MKLKLDGQRSYTWVMVACGVFNVGVGIWNVFLGEWFLAVNEIVLGCVFAGMGWVAASWQRNGFFRGYWAARRDVWDSMLEARKRGMAWEDWIDAELEREAGLLGIHGELGLGPR